MAKLLSETRNQLLVEKLSIAESFSDRLIGLLGTDSLAQNSALWIHQCNSIHTFFMNYGIDCVFLDKQMQVKKVVSNVKPYRLVWPIRGADSVVEMPAGVAKEKNIQVGEKLYVGN